MTAALQEHMLAGNTGRILEAINNAEAVIGRQEISFPRIAVFGDESTGKSSLLEAICKVPFPRGSKVTTKCPTQVRLQRKPGPWSATAWTAAEESSERRNVRKVKSPEELTSVISELQTLEIELANKRNGVNTDFSTVPITISIEAEDVVDLTLVDLPGYFERTLLDGGVNRDKSALEKSQNDIRRVKETLLDCLEDESTILLIVVPANTNLKNTNILKLIEESKRDFSNEEIVDMRARTVYCFTKCDLVGKGGESAPQDIEEILSNKGGFRADPHGWYAVINKGGSGSEKNFTARLKHDREHETKYFQDHSPYNKSHLKNRCGTTNLIQALAGLLAQEISKNIPNMLSESSKALSDARMELRELGSAPVQAQNLQQEFDLLVQDVRTYYKNATMGKYHDLEDEAEGKMPQMNTDTLNLCKLGKIMKDRYAEYRTNIMAETIPLTDDEYLQGLLRKVGEAVDGRLDDVLPVMEVVFSEVRICAKKWKKLSSSLCDDIADAAITCLNVIIDVKASKYERLPTKLKDYVERMITEQKQKAQDRLQWHYIDEIVRPNTKNVLFVKACTEGKDIDGLGSSDDSNRNTFVKVLKAYLPVAEARYIDNALSTITTHIMDVPLGEKITRVDGEMGATYLFLANCIRGDVKVEDLMKIRDDLSQKRSNVTVKIEELLKLREALQMQPASSQFSGIHPNGETTAESINGKASNGKAHKGSESESSDE